jgi:hypothetical protein
MKIKIVLLSLILTIQVAIGISALDVLAQTPVTMQDVLPILIKLDIEHELNVTLRNMPFDKYKFQFEVLADVTISSDDNFLSAEINIEPVGKNSKKEIKNNELKKIIGILDVFAYSATKKHLQPYKTPSNYTKNNLYETRIKYKHYFRTVATRINDNYHFTGR